MTAPPLRPLVLIGAGGHAHEVAQIVRDLQACGEPWQLLGVLVEPGHEGASGSPTAAGAEAAGALLGPLLGPPEWLLTHPDVQAVVAIGRPEVRRRITAALAQAQPQRVWPSLVHPTAWRADDARVGPGSVVFPRACLSTGVHVGAHCIVNLACTLSHGVEVLDHAQLGPGCHLAGGVRVGPEADVGAGVVARPGARIGARAVVGAGAVVIGPVPEGRQAFGVPARPRGSSSTVPLA